MPQVRLSAVGAPEASTRLRTLPLASSVEAVVEGGQQRVDAPGAVVDSGGVGGIDQAQHVAVGVVGECVASEPQGPPLRRPCSAGDRCIGLL
jgi:hypothetical protein